MTEELNRRHNLATTPTTNNNGESYIVPFDIYKEGYDAYDISNWFKGRVGDNGTPFGIRWYKHGQLMDITGMRPFIEGQVGNYTIDDSDPDDPKINMDSEASNVHVVGDVNDCQEYGVAIYRLINQAMPQSGIFYGKIGVMGTQDDGTTVMSSVDIVFKVLAGHMNMLGARKFYVSELEKAWLDLQARIKQYNQEYKDATDKQSEQFKEDTEKALADLNTKIANEIKRAEDTLGDTQAAIDANLASLKQLATSVGSLQSQIEADDLETNFDHKADIKALKDDIGFRFSQIKHPVQAYDSLDQIKAKYPNGADGDYLAVDTGHIYIYQWDTKSWKDCGVYQSQGLSQEDQDTLRAAVKSMALKNVSADPKTAPYNDLDTLPANTIVTYSHNYTGLKNVPSVNDNDRGYTVITYNFYPANAGGAVQVLTTEKGYRFWRMKWGWPEKWGTWHNEMYGDHNLIDSNLVKTAPYNDLNTLPNNNVYIYTDGLDQVEGAPANFTHGIVMTINARDDNQGKFQIVADETQTAFRVFYKGGNQRWQRLSGHFKQPVMLTGDLTENPPKEYADVNNLPVNQVTIYSNFDKILNAPPVTNATILTLGSDWINFNQPNNTIEGRAQIAFTASPSPKILWRLGWGYPDYWTAWKSLSNDEYVPKPSLALFRNIGIIGDSYASGELAFNIDTDHYNMSWGQILARKNGATAINYSRGGQTTRGWLADTERGLGLLNSTNAQDLYILSLGINDYQKLGKDYLGTEDDIEKGADTFFGNYGKIIKAIQAKAPFAKIVISTLSQTDATATLFNNAIETIANHFNIPCLVLNDDKLFTSSLWSKNLHGGHPTGPIYAEMANAYERLISQAMVEDISYFENYEEGMPTDNANDLNRINAKTSVE